MSKLFMAVVDGSGDEDGLVYSTEMMHSFCSQLHQQLGRMKSAYMRGPTWAGERMRERGEWASDQLRLRQADPTVRLMLAGYSRGASAVIMAAEILQVSKIPVAAMFLFDPVAMHLSAGGRTIPANVHFVAIVRRRFSPHLLKKYDHTIGPDLGPLGSTWRPIFHNPMREFFGTTGLSYAGTGELMEAEYSGSHGALGGVGWEHVREDWSCQKHVAFWMNEALSKANVPVVLKAHPPSNRPA